MGIALFAALAIAAGCGSNQPKFSIPVCQDVDKGCGCMIANWIICDHVCVDPAYDPMNCGGCGVVCTGVCAGGKCASDCGALPLCAGRCASMNDPYNCGGCGTLCDGPCAQGTCQSPPVGSTTGACPTGQMSCSAGCTDITRDPFNCGGCGLQCPDVLGICYKNAQGAYRCCSGMLCNGVCIDIKNDPQNCGDCGVICTNSCSFGTCQ
jgi:hypothetical protein